MLECALVLRQVRMGKIFKAEIADMLKFGFSLVFHDSIGGQQADNLIMGGG